MSFKINGSVVVDDNKNGKFTTLTVEEYSTEASLPTVGIWTPGTIVFVANYSGGGPRHVYVEQSRNWV
jgi:hypothetical protein